MVWLVLGFNFGLIMYFRLLLRVGRLRWMELGVGLFLGVVMVREVSKEMRVIENCIFVEEILDLVFEVC